MNKYLLLSLLALTSGANAMNSSRPSSSIPSSEESSEIQYISIDTEGSYTFPGGNEILVCTGNLLQYKWNGKLYDIRTTEGLEISSSSQSQINMPYGSISSLDITVSRRPGAQGNNSSNTLSDPMERERIKL